MVKQLKEARGITKHFNVAILPEVLSFIVTFDLKRQNLTRNNQLHFKSKAQHLARDKTSQFSVEDGNMIRTSASLSVEFLQYFEAISATHGDKNSISQTVHTQVSSYW